MEGEVASLMLAAGFMHGLGMPQVYVLLLVGGTALLVVLLVVILVRQQAWPLSRAIVYALFFASLGFGLGYGIEWFFMDYLMNNPRLLFPPIPSSTPTATAPW